jgi:hypothetical protein
LLPGWHLIDASFGREEQSPHMVGDRRTSLRNTAPSFLYKALIPLLTFEFWRGGDTFKSSKVRSYGIYCSVARLFHLV